MKTAWLLAQLLAVAFLASGCGSDGGERGDLPDNFPGDFPIYEGARPIEQQSAEGLVRVRFETEATRQDITNFYREVLDRSPWRVLTARDSVFEEESLVTFQNVDQEILGSVGVVIRKETGKTNFVVALTITSQLTPPPSIPGSSPAGP